MNGINVGKGACCPQRAEGVTHLRIGQRGIVVGLLGLDTIFQQLYVLGHGPDEVADEELVEMVRTFNYIPRSPAVEADYAVALRQAYRLFHTKTAKAIDAGASDAAAPISANGG